MIDRKSLLAWGLAAVAIVQTLISDLGIAAYLGISLRTIGIIGIGAAIASFPVARHDGSIFVSASLVAKGVLDTMFAVQAAFTFQSLGRSSELVLEL